MNLSSSVSDSLGRMYKYQLISNGRVASGTETNRKSGAKKDNMCRYGFSPDGEVDIDPVKVTRCC